MIDRRIPRPQRQVAWLVAFAVMLTTAAEAAPRRGRAGDLSVSIVSIGRAKVDTGAKAETQRAGTAYYYVHHWEPLAIWVSAPLPPRAKLYPLVRREGTDIWSVQPEAVGPGGRNVPGEWMAQVEFGGSDDAGTHFELLVIVAVEPLPQTRVPDGMRVASTLTGSATVRVERRRGRASVGVAAIDGVPVYGNEELIVHETATVEVVARDLPAESQAGLTVQPAGTDQHWVMPGALGNGAGEITGYFGEGDGSERSFHYTVSAFVVWDDALPPVGLPISSLEWKTYQAAFLAESRGVRVVRWQRELQIEAIGGIPALPGQILAVDHQVDVQGAAQRKLVAGERIWIVCLPLQGDPWVAGWTTRLRPSGHWVVNAARLGQERKPARFDVVAVISAEDATRIQPGALRRWLYEVERPYLSTRVWVQLSGVAETSAPRVGRSRP